ncbi:flagellar biosynthesis protein FlgJ [Donghicola sp. C2-DW-16]|uniref:Basal-body rod modification protein FlgD n=1 Tax=Donghicola mangrovi TaxID=2729614 RepID=A0A850PZ85_9RHOB|nr:flagellar hook capping FlgD N-terminal domain-containing protein [Donghicola mangrovi]NVO22103.1 flagellar biosynthesis protein FlgJ [Donghicola mangrovi]NVO26306.1 flagellar biosynthesis protein FlgJ [Donghicola mangrovi]
MTTVSGAYSNIAGVREYDTESLKSTVAANNKDLGQQDFLTLMTAQLQNQDPFSPMENGDFLAQMAQFSSVAGLDKINETLTSMSSEMTNGRIATASSLLGQSVLVPGNLARPDSNGEIHGVVDLETSADNVTVTFMDTVTGAILNKEQLGGQRAGLVGFDWTDVPDNIVNNHSSVRVSVEVTNGEETKVMGASVYARVTGVQMPTDGGDMTLNIEDYGQRNYLEISALR